METRKIGGGLPEITGRRGGGVVEAFKGPQAGVTFQALEKRKKA